MHPRARTFRDLLVWQRSKNLVAEVYRITESFPAGERFGLVSQMRRAALSVPANIAEGWARGSRAELRRGCATALGSLHELESFVEIAVDLAIVEAKAVARLQKEVDEIGRMLTALKRRLSVPSS